MRGIGSKPKGYVCDSDRNYELEEHWTTFWVTPRNHERSNMASLKYSRALREGRSGELDPVAMNKADRESFLEYCSKVENFAFSEDFYEKHPEVAQLANGDGFIAVIDTPELLVEVARDLSNAALQELSNVVNDPVKLSEGLKKS